MRSAQIIRISTALASLLLSGAWVTASAQVYEESNRYLKYSPDPSVRSTRLLGMGRLTYVVEDVHSRIQLWEFAGNPTGIMSADSTTTLELAPYTTASSSLHDVPQATGPYPERQSHASRTVRLMYEAWHRREGSAAYGLIGEYSTLRNDVPLGEDFERRTSFTIPAFMGVVNGPMPYLWSDRMTYALRLHYRIPSGNDRFRDITSNAAGSYIDQDGQVGEPLDFFTADEVSVRSLGGGVAFSYRFGEPFTLALGVDNVGHEIDGRNQGNRYRSETDETRPVVSGQASVVGRIASLGLEYGLDGQAWSADSKRTWVFSMSAGTATPAVGGRGRYWNREEDGNTFRSRLRWTRGNLEIGGGFNSAYQRVQVIAPPVTDTTSFNSFRNRLVQPPPPPATIAPGDTLTLPDSVANNIFTEHAWDAGGGVSLRVPSMRSLFAVEFHAGSLNRQQDLNGRGPRADGWDVRAGVEYAATEVLNLRAGYIYHQDDEDAFVEQDEYTGHAVTLGFGVTPEQASWMIQAGLLLDWQRPDFGDPTQERVGNHQASLRISWGF